MYDCPYGCAVAAPRWAYPFHSQGCTRLSIAGPHHLMLPMAAPGSALLGPTITSRLHLAAPGYPMPQFPPNAAPGCTRPHPA